MTAARQVVHVPNEAASWPIAPDWSRLDSLCDGVFDCPHTTPQLTESGPFVVRSQDIRTGVFRLDQAGRVSEETYRERIERAEPRLGDLFFSREGTYFGIAAEMPQEARVCLGQRMVLIRPKHFELNSRFLRYWLNSPLMAAHIASFKDGSVAERLNMPTIRGLPVPRTNLERQTQIAAVLGALDDKIELNQRMNETLEAMARAIFKDWFVDFGPTRAKQDGRAPYLTPEIWSLFPDRIDDEGKPRGWSLSRFGEFFRLERGLSYKGEYLTQDGVPMVNLGCFQGGGRFDVSKIKPYSGEFRPRHRIRQGDLVIANTDVTQNRVVLGSPHVMSSDEGVELIFTHHVYAARPLNLDARRWTWFFYFHLLQPEFRERAEGFATGTTVLFLPNDAAELCTFVIPTEALNAAILAIFEPLLQAQTTNGRQNRTLGEIRNLLLPKLMSGEIRVRDAEKIISEAL
jgi:type I restriction enzyme S subunit